MKNAFQRAALAACALLAVTHGSAAQRIGLQVPEPPRVQQPAPVLFPTADRAPWAPAVLASAEGDYTLTPGDTIQLTIFREPDLTASSTIANDGTVQFPLIQEIKLSGMSVREAKDLLTKRYSEKYLVDPQVYISVLNFAQRKFTILGQVSRPGIYPLEGGQPLDLLEAIGVAGGFTRIADQGRVLIRRRTADGVELLRANAKRMSSGKAEAVLIQPGDVITVAESWF